MKKSNVLNDFLNDSSIKKGISKLTKPIFDKVLQELPKNHVSVGSGQVEESHSYSFYNPHNARYYFKFDRKSLHKKPGGGVGSFHKILRVINSTELCCDDFLGCRVVVKKHLIEITNKINKERLFTIEGTEDNRAKQVKESVSILLHECIDVLFHFIKTYGGNSNYVCVTHHVLDNKILHDKIVDNIDSKATFRNDVVKNVYKTNPPNIEFSDPIYASNYFRNMGLNDYSPVISGELASLRVDLEKFKVDHAKELNILQTEALAPLTEQIKTHLAVQHSTLALQKQNLELNKEMSETLKQIRNNSNQTNVSSREKRVKKLLVEYGW